MLAVGAGGRVAERRPGWQRNLRRRMPRPLVRAIRQAQRAVRGACGAERAPATLVAWRPAEPQTRSRGASRSSRGAGS